MSDIVKATVKQNHYGSKGMRLVGEEIELSIRDAEELKHRGLIDFDGKATAPAKGEKILAPATSDTTTTAIVENGSDAMEPVSKSGLEQAKSMEKAEHPKKKGK